MNCSATDPKQGQCALAPIAVNLDKIVPLPLDEARRVVFLMPHDRPMGALFDEGILTREQLMIALTHSTSRHVRRAAKTFLNLLDQAPTPGTPSEHEASAVATVAVPVAKPVPMTLAQARAVTWPFREHRGKTMGHLLDRHLLTLRDLAFACEQAYNPLVRAAAHTCLQHRLDARIAEPPAPAGPLQVFTSARRHTERQLRQLTLLQGMLYGAVIIACVLLMAGGILAWSRQFNPAQIAAILTSAPWPVSVVAVLIVLGVMAGAVVAGQLGLSRSLEWVDRKLEDRVQAIHAGQRGEDQVADALRQILDGTWALYRCVSLPGQKHGDIDAVLVGPASVWALEIKTWSGTHRNTGDTWQTRTKRGWRPVRKSPSLQAKRNATRLAQQLASQGVSLFIRAAVVWTNPTNPPLLDSPSVPVWTLEELGPALRCASHGAPYPAETSQQIRALLQHLIVRAGQVADEG